MPGASSGDRAVSSDILTFQCRFWAAGATARLGPWARGRADQRTSLGAPDPGLCGRSSGGRPAQVRVRARPGNGPGKSATTGRLRTRCHGVILPRPSAHRPSAKDSTRLVQRAATAPGARARRHEQQLVDQPARALVHGERAHQTGGHALVVGTLPVGSLARTVRARRPTARWAAAGRTRPTVRCGRSRGRLSGTPPAPPPPRRTRGSARAARRGHRRRRPTASGARTRPRRAAPARTARSRRRPRPGRRPGPGPRRRAGRRRTRREVPRLARRPAHRRRRPGRAAAHRGEREVEVVEHVLGRPDRREQPHRCARELA